MSDFTWKTKDGKEILIRDMETSHIENCMRIIKNNNYGYTERFGGFDEPYYDENYVCLRDTYEFMALELRLRKIEAKI